VAVPMQRGTASGSTIGGELQSRSEKSGDNSILKQMLVMMQQMSRTQELLVQQLAHWPSGPRASGENYAVNGSDNDVWGEGPRSNSCQSGATAGGDITKKLASQIPIFKGTEKENVDRWLSRVSFVGELYKVSDETLLLAATGRFEGEASK
jgi:hypothetical protein